MKGLQNIDDMFAAAAAVAEDTEGNVDEKKAAKVEPKPQPKPEPKVEPKPEVKVEPKPESKPEPKTAPKVEQPKPEPKVEPKPEPKPQSRPPIVATTGSAISEDSIRRILEMNNTFDKFNATEKSFVSGYFKLEEEDISRVIHKALIASKRDLDALSKIVDAKSQDPAGRAFFLMSLDNMVIEDIFEQVELLTGQLGENNRVNDSNKLKVCIAIEAVIADMEKDVFTYIEKLQTFTNIAIK